MSVVWEGAWQALEQILELELEIVTSSEREWEEGEDEVLLISPKHCVQLWTLAMELGVADLEESDRRWTGLVDGFGGAESEMEQALMEDASGSEEAFGAVVYEITRGFGFADMLGAFAQELCQDCVEAQSYYYSRGELRIGDWRGSVKSLLADSDATRVENASLDSPIVAVLSTPAAAFLSCPLDVSVVRLELDVLFEQLAHALCAPSLDGATSSCARAAAARDAADEKASGSFGGSFAPSAASVGRPDGWRRVATLAGQCGGAPGRRGGACSWHPGVCQAWTCAHGSVDGSRQGSRPTCWGARRWQGRRREGGKEEARRRQGGLHGRYCPRNRRRIRAPASYFRLMRSTCASPLPLAQSPPHRRPRTNHPPRPPLRTLPPRPPFAPFSTQVLPL